MENVRLEDYDLAEVGTEHDFRILSKGEVVAGIWHSDKGEWTIESIDGPVYRRGSRQDAVDFVVRNLLAL